MTQAQFKPLAIPAAEAFRAIGIGSSKGWQLIALGELDARKIGRRTVVTTESLDRFMDRLPRVKSRSAPDVL